MLMAGPKGDQAVRDAMASYAQAMLKSDTAALGKLFGDKIMYSHSNAKLENKAEAIAAVGKDKYAAFDFSDMNVESHGKMAVVRCNVLVKNSTNPAGLKLSVLHVWEKSPAGWQMVARQSTRYPAN